MMKNRFFLLLGILTLFGVGFYFSRPEMSAKMLPFCSGFVFSYLLVRWLMERKKHYFKKDEMTKKAGYTALALSFQILTLIGLILGIIDYFFPFLKNYSARDTIMVMIIIGGLCVCFFGPYYSHHPEKTWL